MNDDLIYTFTDHRGDYEIVCRGYRHRGENLDDVPTMQLIGTEARLILFEITITHPATAARLIQHWQPITGITVQLVGIEAIRRKTPEWDIAWQMLRIVREIGRRGRAAGTFKHTLAEAREIVAKYDKLRAAGASQDGAAAQLELDRRTIERYRKRLENS